MAMNCFGFQIDDLNSTNNFLAYSTNFDSHYGLGGHGVNILLFFHGLVHFISINGHWRSNPMPCHTWRKREHNNRELIVLEHMSLSIISSNWSTKNFVHIFSMNIP
ncbi:hypothetical protein HPP92_016109 [Vanilla planifolia]|uniref:Uncharacterized protein n=1 Tax=Vanilla planifolia TaxID=51239 RepID=A0A835URS3_VANPL|nr:hypothetical protein HPP92_016109 [Vanilla planifolia]